MFKNRVISTFHSIPVETVNHLIRSMPKRIDMVIRNKGKRIKYSRNTTKCILWIIT